MAKEVKVYITDDGKQFKTKKGAENHEKRILIEAKVEELGMTKEEIAEKLHEVAPYNMNITFLLKEKGEWYEDWPNHLIQSINAKTLQKPLKKTLYLKAENELHSEKLMFTEEGEEFGDPEKHLNDNIELKKVEEVDKLTLKVYYDDVKKLTKEDVIQMKLEDLDGDPLDEEEIEYMINNLTLLYEEKGDIGRWNQPVTTVVDLNGQAYAIEWLQGLTERQEDQYDSEPYKVKLEVKEIVVKKAFITKI